MISSRSILRICSFAILWSCFQNQLIKTTRQAPITSRSVILVHFSLTFIALTALFSFSLSLLEHTIDQLANSQVQASPRRVAYRMESGVPTNGSTADGFRERRLCGVHRASISSCPALQPQLLYPHIQGTLMTFFCSSYSAL